MILILFTLPILGYAIMVGDVFKPSFLDFFIFWSALIALIVFTFYIQQSRIISTVQHFERKARNKGKESGLNSSEI